MSGVGLAQPAVTLSEAQAYVRVETGEEEAVLAGLICTASALCEAFIGQVMIARNFEQDLAATSGWSRLSLTPVKSIDDVLALSADGASTLMSPSDFAVDIDSKGDGWVRISGGYTGRIRVVGRAGVADTQNEVPEPIRQGILRLVAHLFATRDGPAGQPPAAVTALWRPYRRVHLT